MNTSPAVKTQNTMDIGDAIRCIARELKVTKLEWNNPREYAVLVGGKVCLHKVGKEFEYYPWLLNDGDLLGTDYVIVHDEIMN